MAFNNLATYSGWQRESRQVVAGEKANQYGKHEDKFYALFHLGQTEESSEPDVSEMEIISAVEREAQRTGKAPRVLLRLKADPSGITEIALWCGSNKKIIEMLKEAKYRYDGKRHRWVAKRRTEDIDKIIQAFGLRGLEAEIESDNRADVVMAEAI